MMLMIKAKHAALTEYKQLTSGQKRCILKAVRSKTRQTPRHCANE